MTKQGTNYEDAHVYVCLHLNTSKNKKKWNCSHLSFVSIRQGPHERLTV